MSGPIPDPEREFLARLKLIERFARSRARRFHLSPEDAEDLVSHVMLKLVEHDYEKLRKFRGESPLEPFLAATVANLSKDYIIALWGKWRASPAARRGGAVSVLLEVLLVREGLSFEAACETLWTNQGVTLTRAELEALAAALPQRLPRRSEPVDDALQLPSADKSPEAVLAEQEAANVGAKAKSVLDATLATWPAQDTLIFQMRFQHGRKVVDISRDLGLPAHPLYTRIERLLATLRVAFVAAGLDPQTILDLLEHWSPDFGWTVEES